MSPELTTLTDTKSQIRITACPSCLASQAYTLNPSYFRRRARVVARRSNPLPVISLSHLRKPRHAAGMRVVGEMLGLFPSPHNPSSSSSSSSRQGDGTGSPTARPGTYLFAVDREYQWLPFTFVEQTGFNYGPPAATPPRYVHNPGYDNSQWAVTANVAVSIDTNVSPLRVFVYQGGNSSGITPTTYIYRGIDIMQCLLPLVREKDTSSSSATKSDKSAKGGATPVDKSMDSPVMIDADDIDTDDEAYRNLCRRAQHLLACMDAEDQCAARYNAMLDSLEARFNSTFAYVMQNCSNLMAAPEVCPSHPYVATRPYECDAQEDIAGAKLLRLPVNAGRLWDEDIVSVSSDDNEDYYRYSVMTTADDLRSSHVKPYFDPRTQANTNVNRSGHSAGGNSSPRRGGSAHNGSGNQVRARAQSATSSVPAVTGEGVEFDGEGRPMVDSVKDHRIAKELPLRGVIPRLKLPKK